MYAYADDKLQLLDVTRDGNLLSADVEKIDYIVVVVSPAASVAIYAAVVVIAAALVGTAVTAGVKAKKKASEKAEAAETAEESSAEEAVVSGVNVEEIEIAAQTAPTELAAEVSDANEDK